MDSASITNLRRLLGLSQAEFGQLFGAHAMTVSKWERGVATPSPYQVALLDKFQRTADAAEAKEREQFKNLLVGAGVVAALVWLFSAK